MCFTEIANYAYFKFYMKKEIPKAENANNIYVNSLKEK